MALDRRPGIAHQEARRARHRFVRDMDLLPPAFVEVFARHGVEMVDVAELELLALAV